MSTFGLTTAKELQQSLQLGQQNCQNLIVIDARRRFEYNAGHIPGAVLMRWEQWCEGSPSGTSATIQQPGWWGYLADLNNENARAFLSEHGILQNTKALVYADGARTKGRDGRIAWTLLYAGVTSVHILNGGWSGWLANGGQTEHGQNKSELTDRWPGKKLNVQKDESRRIFLQEIKDLILSKSACSIDTRTREEFAGDSYDYQPRKGRIPGSINIPFDSLYKSDGNFASAAEYEQLLDEAGCKSKIDFVYCEVGVRAATFSLLHELYLGQKLPVFDGSFMEWSLNLELPIEIG